ncbi:MAG: hypothetical protein JSR86_22265 [Proteobacteria bacterium]|nr:hypothetical protein [Pseudomonadota bacterium]
MTLSTIERAYEMARSGDVPDLAILTSRLKSEGYRAVDALLSPRMLRGHLQAICRAAAGGASLAEPDRILGPGHDA